MSELAALTMELGKGRELTAAEIVAAAGALAGEAEADAAKGAFLVALTEKGETAAELAALADYFRARAVDPGVQAWAPRAIDIVGTGGDHAGGFNISSLVTLVLATAGVMVMKHGNRGITSKCGSADLLAALGVNLEAPPEQVRRALDQLGFCFFFAPAYHPAFRRIAPVRKALAAEGRRSVFNVLGPLINPGRPARTLLGVSAPALVDKLAPALDALGSESALVVHGRLGPDRGIDELTTATENRVRGAGRFRGLEATWRAVDFGLPAAPFAELQGGDVATNRAIAEAILAGRGPAGLVDTIVLNAAAGLWLSGQVGEIRDGLAPARELLASGAVARKVAATREFYAAG